MSYVLFLDHQFLYNTHYNHIIEMAIICSGCSTCNGILFVVPFIYLR